MDIQIEIINFGNKVFDDFLNNENVFVKMFKKSKPYRFCVESVFSELVSLGVYPRFEKIKKLPIWENVIAEEKKMFSSKNNFETCCKAILVLQHFGEQRLKVTSGL